MASISPSDRTRKNAKRPIGTCFTTELDQQLLHDIRTSTHGGYAIGSSRFREEIQSALKLRATPRGPGRPPGGAGLGWDDIDRC